EPGMRMPEPAQQFAVMAVDADPRPAIRQIDVDRHVGPDLADIKSAILARLHVQPRRPVHVDPLALVLAVAVEHLHAVVFAVGDTLPSSVHWRTVWSPSSVSQTVSSGAMNTPCGRTKTPSPQLRSRLPSRSKTHIGCLPRLKA